MSGLATKRLMIERKKWRKDHPYVSFIFCHGYRILETHHRINHKKGFYAKPRRGSDGKANLFLWDCGVPGKEGTIWAGGKYKVTLNFPPNYPTKPPLVKFEPGFFHVNVYTDGRVCLSIINEQEGWKAGITVKQILLGVQDLLNNPNPKSPANPGAAATLRKGRQHYNKGILQMVRKYRSDL